MKIAKWFLIAALVAVPWGMPLRAQTGPGTTPGADAPGMGTQYSDKGADTCLNCHDEEADTLAFSTAGIFRGKHAQRGNRHAPFGPGGLQCEACHGPGARHSVKEASKSTRARTINSFKANSFLDVGERNQACLNCHAGRAHTTWAGSAHERGGVACTDCHQLHADRDRVLARETQSTVCLRCHTRERADFLKASAHPVRAGRVACNDCHRPHGTEVASSLRGAGTNATCYSCHADKRGPLLWEHAPVAEDCTLCHASHGSNQASLLKKSAPLLCQQCHSVAGHPSVPRTAAGLPGRGGGGSIFITAASCANCHSQVHGSNHPAGAKLMR
jgi:DmsE family decaheme c-type cytochrome